MKKVQQIQYKVKINKQKNKQANYINNMNNQLQI